MKEKMSGVRGVLNYAGCFAETAGMDGKLVCVMDWATFTTFCSFLQSWEEQEPYPSCDTTRKNAFYGASVKVGESCG